MAPSPASGTDSRAWIAIDGINLATVSLQLGGVSGTVNGLNLAISQSSGQAVVGSNTTRGPPLDWSADLSLDGGQTYGGASNEADPGGVAALKIAYTTTQFGVGGTLANLNVYNVLKGAATFAINESTVGASLGNNVTLSGASLLTVGITGLTASVGSGSFGISVSGGSLGVALLEPSAPSTGTDSRYWLSVVGTALAGSLTLGAGVTASVSGGSVAINQAGGVDASNNAATALDWTKSLDLNGDGVYGGSADQVTVASLPVTATARQLLVSGSLTQLNIDNLLNASANFAVGEATVNATLGNNVTLTGASLLTVGLSGLTASAGSNNFGIAVTGGNLGVALLEPAAAASDSRYWLAIVGTGLGGTLTLGSTVTASVSGGSVAINQAGGVDASNNAATALNWTTSLDLDGDGQYGSGADQVDAGANLSPPVSLPIATMAAKFVVAGSLTNLNIDSVLGGSATFALSEATVSPTVGGAALNNAELVTVGLGNLQASAGVGSFGISVSGGNLGLAVLEATPESAGADKRYWVAVTSSGLSGSLNLGGSVTASVQNVAVAINQAGGADASNNAATPLNWSTTFNPAVDPGTNLPSPPATSLAITATGGGVSVSGTLTSLDIFGILTGSANFSLNDSTVSPAVGGATLTNATLLTVGLSNLQVAAGSGGFGIAISGGNLGVALLEVPKPTSGTDTRYWLAVIGSNGLAGTLTLGSGVAASVSNVSVAINTAGGTNGTPASALSWNTVFNPPVSPISGLTVTLSGAQFGVMGTLNNLNLDNVLQLAGNFSVGESTVNATLSSTASLTNATLLTVGLSNVTGSASTGSFGIAVTGGSVGLAILEPPAPATGTDSRYWLAVVASGLAGNLTLGGLSASVTNGTVAINQQGGTDASNNPATALDWTKAFSTPVMPIAGLTVTSTGDQVTVGGTLPSLNIDNVVNASATFLLSESTVNATLNSTTTLTNASLLTLGLTATATASGFGVTLGGTIGVALLEPAAPASGTDSRYWLAVVASGLSGSLSLGSGVSATVQNGAVAINQAGGVDASNVPASPLNWNTAFGSPISPIAGVTIQLATGQLLVSGSLTSLNVFNVIKASANFAVSETLVDLSLGTTTVTNATLLTAALSNLNASASAGGYGVAIAGGNLGIAFIERLRTVGRGSRSSATTSREA